MKLSFLSSAMLAQVIAEAQQHQREISALQRSCDQSTARLLRHAVDHINSGRLAEAVLLLTNTIENLER